jgi:hypothetical protein
MTQLSVPQPPRDPASAAGPAEALAEVSEPVEVRAGWWEAERAGTDHPDLVAGVTGAAWAAWEPVLVRAGVDRTWLGELVASYRRELWLWTAGERQWAQVVAGLAGRVRRRLPH